MKGVWGDLPTWLIFAASAVNVGVLWWYARLTRGILKETRAAGARTEDMARQSREALKAQILATLFQVEEAIKTRAIMPQHGGPNPWPTISARRQEFERAFPTTWPEIEPFLDAPPGETKK